MKQLLMEFIKNSIEINLFINHNNFIHSWNFGLNLIDHFHSSIQSDF